MAFELEFHPRDLIGDIRRCSCETFDEIIAALKARQALSDKDDHEFVIVRQKGGTAELAAEQRAELATYGKVLVQDGPMSI